MGALAASTSAAHATEQSNPATSSQTLHSRQAEVPAFDQSTALRTASGQTAAPGGNGAYVGIKVNGNQRYVTDVFVNYMSGTELATGNPEAEAFEIAYNDGGRKVESHGPDAGFVRATAT